MRSASNKIPARKFFVLPERNVLSARIRHAVVSRSGKDAIPYHDEANSVRNLVTRNGGRYGLLQLCLTVAFALMLIPATALGQTFVQQAQNVPNSGASATFTAAEHAGALNVVVVGWFDQVSSVNNVTDSNWNTYVLAGTSGGEGVSEAIYYAKNISI